MSCFCYYASIIEVYVKILFFAFISVSAFAADYQFICREPNEVEGADKYAMVLRTYGTDRVDARLYKNGAYLYGISGTQKEELNEPKLVVYQNERAKAPNLLKLNIDLLRGAEVSTAVLPVKTNENLVSRDIEFSCRLR